MEGAAGARHVAVRVEPRGDLAGGVIVQQLVDPRHDLRTGLAELPRGQRRRQLEAGRRATAKADMGGQPDGRLDERDVVEEETHHALAFAIRGLGMVPELREIRDDLPKRGALVIGDRAVGLSLLLVGVLRRRHRTEGLIPLRLEGRGDQAMIGIDPQITPAREVGLVLRTFDLLAP